MLWNPPPDRCDACGRVARSSQSSGLAAGDPRAWVLLSGAGEEVLLDDGRRVGRLGRGWVCRRCGHTVPVSYEHAPGRHADGGAKPSEPPGEAGRTYPPGAGMRPSSEHEAAHDRGHPATA